MDIIKWLLWSAVEVIPEAKEDTDLLVKREHSIARRYWQNY